MHRALLLPPSVLYMKRTASCVVDVVAVGWLAEIIHGCTLDPIWKSSSSNCRIADGRSTLFGLVFSVTNMATRPSDDSRLASHLILSISCWIDASRSSTVGATIM